MTKRKAGSRGNDAQPRRFWTSEEDAQLIALYPDMSTAKLAKHLQRTLCATYGRADKLGLAKSAAYLASPDACRLRRGDNVGAAYRFPQGHAPANKGLRRPGYAPGRMKETQFTKGQNGWNWRPVGSERLVDGYLYTKVSDVRNVPYTVNWKPTHVLMWEAANGPLAPGCALVFENGDRLDVRLDNLKCITRKELMLRNSVHNLPAPLPQVVQLLGALNRKINRANRQDEKQDRGSAQSPVRSTGRACGQGEPAGRQASEGDRGRSACDRGRREGGGGVHEGDGRETGNGVHRAPRRGAGARITVTTRRSKRAHALVTDRSSFAGAGA